MQFGVSVLLIIHALLAVLLLGGITHQAIAAGWPVAKRGQGFFNSLRGVNGMSYTNAIVILFLVTFVFGTIIYPAYRLSVCFAGVSFLQARGDVRAKGAFTCFVVSAASALLAALA